MKNKRLTDSITTFGSVDGVGEMHIDWENFLIYIVAVGAAIFVFVGIWKASTPNTRSWAWVATIAFIFSLALEIWLVTTHFAAQ
jgi:hypothetical protein